MKADPMRAGVLRAILTYHSLDESGSPISVRPSVFAGHVRSLKSANVRVLGVEELWTEVSTGTESSRHAVAITFDDGFANFAEHGAPVLEEFGFPSTVFVVSGHAGRDNKWGGVEDPGIPLLPLLDWSALGRLADNGVRIGAHTRAHPSLDFLSPEEVEREIVGGADDIVQHLGVRPSTFAYPYGAWTEPAARCVSENFALGVTTDFRTLTSRDTPALLPRIDAYYLRKIPSLRDWGSPRFRARLRLRSALRSIRAGLVPPRRPQPPRANHS